MNVRGWFAIVWMVCLAVPAWAGRDLNLTVGGAKVILVKDTEKVAIGNSEIADVKQINRDELLLTGKNAGSTTLIVWDAAGRKDVSTVVVSVGKAAQTMIQVDVQVMELVRKTNGNYGLDWERLVGPGGELLLKETTVPLKALGALERGKLDLALEMLEEKGLAKVLARPKLLTLSGRKASFSSGGEIPVSTVNSTGQVSTEWKKFGINLDVQPVANDSGTINAEIRAEVSDADFTQLVQGNPSIKTRWASTTIHVNSDETVVIGGLIQDKQTTNRQGVPLLMDIPILGYLFQSTTIINEESELVIFVTPRLVGR